MVKLRTVCECIIWSGFFGIDESERDEEITVEVEPEEIEDKDGILPTRSNARSVKRCWNGRINGKS